MTTKLPLIALVSVVTASSCIIHDDREPPPDPFGDLAFEWSFDGIPSCDEAQIDEVDVEIFQGGELVFLQEREPCEGGGLIFTDIATGRYEVFVDAYDRNGLVQYSGSFDIRVEGGVVNDAGVVVLQDVNGPPESPPVQLGTLAFFWVFSYPTDDRLTADCALGGVDEVDVTVTPLGNAGAAFEQTYSCGSEGVEVTNLPEGRYELQVTGYGEYHQDPILLYDTGIVTVDVFGDQLTELEDVILERVDGAFSDFDLAWTLVDETCASVGLGSVTLSFQRFGQDVPEDAFTVDCVAASVLRRTFVPGSYDVSVAGVGGGDVTYVGTQTVDLPPGAVAEVDVVLAPVG